MNDPLEYLDPIRDGIDESLADLPVVTMAWRSLRGEYQRRAESLEIEKNALADLGEEVHRLLLATGGYATQSGPEEGGEGLGQIARNLERALRKLDVAIIAPVGQEYTDDLAEIRVNRIQQADADVAVPTVAKILRPAIRRGRDLLRMGEAVVAIPPHEAPPDDLDSAAEDVESSE